MKNFKEPVLIVEAIEIENVIATSVDCDDDFVCEIYEPCDWEV